MTSLSLFDRDRGLLQETAQEQDLAVQNLDRISESSDSNDDDEFLESDDDDEFVHSQGEDISKTIATESKHHGNWRIVVVSFLLLMGAGLAVLTFQSLDTLERGEKKKQFQALVIATDSRARDHAGNIINSLERLASQYEKEAALASVEPSNFVTLPRFEYAGRSVLENGLQVVSYAPIIESRDDGYIWQNYSVANYMWATESYELADQQRPTNMSITPYIWFGRDFDGTPIPATIRPTPFVPLWQTSPPPPSIRDVINQDMHAFEYFPSLVEEVRQTRSPVISTLENASAIWGDLVGEGENHALLVYPMNTKTEAVSGQVDALLVTAISWDLFMANAMNSNVMDGVNSVLLNSCGQKVLYANGDKTGVLANDDLLRQSMSARLTGNFPLFHGLSYASDRQGGCTYSVQLYSSYQSFGQSNSANLMPLVVFAMFVAISFFFILYDRFLEGRIAKVAEQAARSNALVTSLFPTQVHDRLFEKDEASESHSKRSKHSARRSAVAKSKYDVQEPLEEDDSGEMFRTHPIADLFPVATLLFADIAGFTAWSSARQPTEVFTLLETLYRNFDMIAKKRGIFKVETVGDCYVAASGLPEPNKYHVVTMSRFARDCLAKTKELVRKLEATLGPDTSQLSVRIGIHSGPVTGGVLRGEKSRFQLFGDSMNTCARIETTGMKGRIHISQETADLLVAAGKVNWFYAREEKVFAKGKGEMNTFWLKTSSSKKKSRRKTTSRRDDSYMLEPSSCDVTEDEADLDSDSNTDSDSDESYSDLETEKLLHDLVSPKTARLIEFNTQILIQFLKRIKRKRAAANVSYPAMELDSKYPAPLCARETPLLSQTKQMVSMAKFDPAETVIFENGSLDDVSLDPAVVRELHDFVTNIAIMYKAELVYHNFQHCSHSILSVTKFLSQMTVGKNNPGRRFDSLVDSASELHQRTHGISSDFVAQTACLFAALVCNMDSPGVSNEQLVKENNELAFAYQGVSIAEQNAFDLAWGLLTDDKYPNLRAAIFDSADERERFRSLVINCVMATDVADDNLRDARNRRWTSLFGEEAATSTPETADLKATLILEYVVRASDVIHGMQHWHIYRQWSGRQFTELYRAFQQGRIDEDPSIDWYDKEITWFDKCIIPIAEKLEQCEVFGVASKEAYTYAVQNRLEWIARGQEIVPEMVATCEKRRSMRPPTSTVSSPAKMNASMSGTPSQAAKVAALMDQVHMLELEEERLRSETGPE